MFSKTCTFPYFFILSHLLNFWNLFRPPPPSQLFFPIPYPRFRKPYLQSKTLLNIRAPSSSAVFCSNAVLVTTLSSSIQIFSFFDVLPSAPTTGMTLMLLMFHILLISLFSPWYIGFFPSLFY